MNRVVSKKWLAFALGSTLDRSVLQCAAAAPESVCVCVYTLSQKCVSTHNLTIRSGADRKQTAATPYSIIFRSTSMSLAES